MRAEAPRARFRHYQDIHRARKVRRAPVEFAAGHTIVPGGQARPGQMKD
ncbi:hypothetical protein FRAHR75_230102 [Frankia sp. Hr75.2]|nr:hypothetical protein FRAHR75_230102 [Frankia sp. Hr75.2]